MIRKIWRYQHAILSFSESLNKKIYLVYIPLFLLSQVEYGDMIKAISFSTGVVWIIRDILYAKSMTVQLTPASTEFKTANLYFLNVVIVACIHLAILAFGGCFVLFQFLWQFPNSIQSFLQFMGERSFETINNETLLLYGLYFMNAMISTTAILRITNQRKQGFFLILCALCMILMGISASKMDFLPLMIAISWMVSIALPLYIIKHRRLS